MRSQRSLQPKATGRDHLIEEIHRPLAVIPSNRAVPRASFCAWADKIGIMSLQRFTQTCPATCARQALGVAFHLRSIEPILPPPPPDDATQHGDGNYRVLYECQPQIPYFEAVLGSLAREAVRLHSRSGTNQELITCGRGECELAAALPWSIDLPRLTHGYHQTERLACRYRFYRCAGGRGNRWAWAIGTCCHGGPSG